MKHPPSKHTITATRRSLLGWYRREARDLPWRRTNDPYCIWISEIMLQQTRVEAVIDYYHRFLEAFPTVQALAQAPIDRVLKQWEGLGYYSRARNLHKTAAIIANERGGAFPKSVEEWMSLPG
ncbi:A/G-specific adenine glycosylase, partial [bacterium]|nr:A/G-specific adenine glycosylase [bacterium]